MSDSTPKQKKNWLGKLIGAPLWIKLGTIGALVGILAGLIWSLTVSSDPGTEGTWTQIVKTVRENALLACLLGAVVGAMVGSLIHPINRWLRPVAKALGITEIPLDVPLLGKVTFKLTSEQQKVAWRLFVELSTRVTVQELTYRAGGTTDQAPSEEEGESTGFLREALSSFYKIFELARNELKGMPTSIPSLLKPEDPTLEVYITLILNDAIRPFLSRWHPRLSAWESTGMPEGQWPMGEYCRGDLRTTQRTVLKYAWDLGRLAGVAKLEKLLPPEPPKEEVGAPLVARKDLEKLDGQLKPTLSAKIAGAGWRIFVELVSRISTQPLDPGTGNLREALTSLHALFRFTRIELKRSEPIPFVPEESPTVEGLALRMLNQSLRPFLAKWHPRLKEWESQNKPESDWPDGDECRKELEQTRKAVAADARKLGQLIGVVDVHQMLPESE